MDPGSPQDARPGRVTDLTGMVRTVVGSQVRTPERREDLVQETLARVLQAEDRLDDSALAPYAVVVARSVVAAEQRRAGRAARFLPRLLHIDASPAPEDEAVRAAEHDAVRQALGALADRDRSALVAHEVEDVPIADLAAAEGTSSGALAVRLARSRSQLRVEYLLAFRGIDELPTATCRPVLLSLSAGDRRRQRALDAAGHLIECETCEALSVPLLERRRSLAGVIPFLLGRVLLTRLGRFARAHPVQAASGGAVTAAVVVGAAVVASGRAQPVTPARRPVVAGLAGPVPTPPVPPGSAPTSVPFPLASEGEPGGAILADGQSVLALVTAGPSLLAGVDGQQVVLRHAPVQALAGQLSPGEGADDERLWVGPDARARILVFLHVGTEPPQALTPGMRMGAMGRLRRYDPADQLGVDPSQLPALAAVGYYIEVTDLSTLTTGS